VFFFLRDPPEIDGLLRGGGVVGLGGVLGLGGVVGLGGVLGLADDGSAS
tara:strand:- start:34 stop:180 length:147 start_codon:yes stop_codon:yes gene_type:complete